MADGYPNYHRCAGGCGKNVSYYQLTCQSCWARLPGHFKHDIAEALRNKRRTGPKPHLAAVRAACEWFRENKQAASVQRGTLVI